MWSSVNKTNLPNILEIVTSPCYACQYSSAPYWGVLKYDTKNKQQSIYTTNFLRLFSVLNYLIETQISVIEPTNNT